MRGRGKGAKETLARKPHDFEKRFLFSPPPPPSIFFCSRYNYTQQLYRVHDVFQREVSVQFNLEETVPTGNDCYAGYSPSLPNACHAGYVVTA